MKLGARIIKTGIAVVLALYVATWLQLEPVFFAAIAAVLTVQPSIYRSWQHMIEQIQANVIGAIIGIAGVFLLGNSPVIIGLMIIIVILINLSLKLSGTISLSIVTVIAVMEVPEGDYFTFALNRLILIMVGILSSILVNIIFIPPKYENKFLLHMKEAVEHLTFLMRQMTDQELEETAYRQEKQKVMENLKKSEELFILYQEERTYRKKSKFQKARKTVVFKQMVRSMHKALDAMHALERHLYTSEPIQKDVVDHIKHQIRLITAYYEKVMLKYEGKVRIHHPHEKDQEMFQGNNQLLEQLIELHHSNDDEKAKEKDEAWLHLFMISAALIELANQLDYLDKLIGSYHTYHQEGEYSRS